VAHLPRIEHHRHCPVSHAYAQQTVDTTRPTPPPPPAHTRLSFTMGNSPPDAEKKAVSKLPVQANAKPPKESGT
jgi:hypothetical protein